VSLTQSEISKLTTKAVETGKTIKRSEQLDVGAGSRGLGSLRTFFLPTGAVRFYYGHKTRQGRQDDYPLGGYAQNPKQAISVGNGYLTLAMARQRALEASKQNAEAIGLGFDGIRDWSAQKAAEADKERLRASVDTSLGALVELYAEVKKAEGKTEYAHDVKNLVKNHLLPYPIAKIDANLITKADVANILRRVKETGKQRTYQKLRSYLLASYKMALDAEFDESCDSRFIPFEIQVIPIAKTSDPRALKVNRRNRFLTVDEIKVFWHYLDQHQCYQSDFVKLKLLTGQRTIQLLRLTVDDVNQQDKSIVLMDPKGRRVEPRRHVVPLVGLSWVIVEDAHDLASKIDQKAVFLNSLCKPVLKERVERWCRDASHALVETGAIKSTFTLGDLRRTFETHMARLRISKDLRAQLASHGIHGVQDDHYDMYDYLDDKRQALELWEREIRKIVNGGYDNVIQANFG